jgi:hypothetical protein
MTTHVQYRGVGESSDSAVPMTTADMSSRLLEDWTPWLLLADGSKLLGWPQQLVRVDASGSHTLDARAAHSERQWKGVVSWMLGVACSRYLLDKKEEYRWIAPASAFYPRATWQVDLGGKPAVALRMWLAQVRSLP